MQRQFDQLEQFLDDTKEESGMTSPANHGSFATMAVLKPT